MISRLMFTGQRWYFTEGFSLVLDKVKISYPEHKVRVMIGGLWYDGASIWKTVKGGPNSFWAVKDSRDIDTATSWKVVRAVDIVRSIIRDMLTLVPYNVAKSKLGDITAEVQKTVISEDFGIAINCGVLIDGVSVFVGAVAAAEIEKREAGIGIAG